MVIRGSIVEEAGVRCGKPTSTCVFFCRLYQVELSFLINPFGCPKKRANGIMLMDMVAKVRGGEFGD